MTLGFTGTSKGLTLAQRETLSTVLRELRPGTVHHGVCIGADEQFHTISTAFGSRTVGHPGVNTRGEVWKRANVQCDESRSPMFFLKRNRRIVAEVDEVVACPRDYVEQTIGSGTWATIRYTRQSGKRLTIVWPDGSRDVENDHAL